MIRTQRTGKADDHGNEATTGDGGVRVQLHRCRHAAGGEIIMAKAGKPLVGLMPSALPLRTKKPGLLESKINVPDDFNAPLDDATPAQFEQE
jgi:antitoxin (DNA-binding transcriptional repressor) of toxin-antitoxin stability system